jgi:Trk K+ transport system NAD-binding subunit
VGVWERGRFKNAGADTVIGDHTVLVLAGSGEQLRAYNELFCIYHQVEAPAVIIGGGRVGRATGKSLEGRKMDYRIVEQLPERIRQNKEKYVLGNAAEMETLEQAGIKQAPAVIITTHDDDTNIYLTIFCRRLRPDIQIISRTTRERNISTLHRAGADFVMSYASMGANIIFNVLKRNDILMLAEGVNVFKVQLPPFLEGKSLAESNLRRRTGCNVIAMHTSRGFEINPDPQQPMEAEAELILIGNVESEQEFLKLYSK